MNSAIVPARHTESNLKKLTPEQVKQIDDYLTSLNDYGEIHLIVQRGELKYINKLESHKIRGDQVEEIESSEKQ